MTLPVRIFIRRRRSWLQVWEVHTPTGPAFWGVVDTGDFACCRLRRRP